MSEVLQAGLEARKRIGSSWSMLLLGMCTYGAFYTGRQNFGIAAAALRSNLHFSAGQIGTISGSMLIAYAVGSFISGFISDRFDARWIVCLGALTSVVLNWSASFAMSYSGALVPWMLNGLAQALGWAPCSRLVTGWFPPSKRASVFGIVLFAAGMASLATYALSLASLHFFGWRAVFRFPVLSLLPMALLFAVFARQGAHHANPSVHPGATSRAIGQHYKPLLWNVRFLSLCASIGCESLARYGLLIWVPIHVLGENWKTSGPGRWLMLLLPLGMALGAVSTGFVSDRLFRKNRALAILGLMGAGSLLVGGLYFVPRSLALTSCLLLLLAGFAVYGPQAAYWTVGMEIGGPRRGGTALGMMDSAAYIFAALGERLIGSVVDHYGTTRSIFPTISLACLAAAVFSLPSLTREEVSA